MDERKGALRAAFQLILFYECGVLFSCDGPLPELFIFLVGYFAGKLHPGFLQDLYGGVVLFLRMRYYFLYVAVAKCKADKGCCQLCTIALLPVIGRYFITDFYHPVLIRPFLKAAGANKAAVFPVYHQVKEPAQHGGIVPEFIIGNQYDFRELCPVFRNIYAQQIRQNIVALQQRLKVLQGAW